DVRANFTVVFYNLTVQPRIAQIERTRFRRDITLKLPNLRNHLLPQSATSDAARLVLARALRGFADGFVSVYLAAYLQLIGLNAIEVGAIVTAMLIGSAVTTLAVGLGAHRLSARSVLFAATGLMAATGIGFAFLGDFWPLFVVGFFGTLNP